MSEDLAFATNDDLITELLGRFDHAAFTGLKVTNESAQAMTVNRRWKGNSFTVAGLAAEIGQCAIDDFTERAERGE